MKVWLKFNRTPIRRRISQSFTVKNNGVVPVSGYIGIKDDAEGSFTLVGGEQMIKLNPKRTASFTVNFNPREVRALEI